MNKFHFISLFILAFGLFSCSKTATEVSPDNVVSNPSTDNTFKTQMLNAVNDLRSQGCTCGSTQMPPVSPLSWDNQLRAAAERHAQDMFDNDNHSHTGTDGSKAGERIQAAGYNWSTFGENIAWGQTSVSAVVEAWKNSSGHCKNMMKSNFEDFGAARVGNKWVQVFGKK